MFVKLCVLFLAIGLSQAGRSRTLPEVSFMQYMMNSRAVVLAGSGNSAECFAVYVPKLQAVIEQWESDTQACEDSAEAARGQIDDNTKDNRTQIDGSATDACDALKVCSEKTNSLDYYDCYSSTGSDDAKVMYTISANSAELLAVVKEDYRLIQNEENVCTNKSERAYVENTAQVYEELDNCLKGIVITTVAPPPSTEPSSSTEPSTPNDSSSAATPPESSTPEASSTAEDSTSEATTAASDEPSDPTDADKENLPEEDLSRLAEEQTKLKSMMEDFKQWFNRH